MCWLLDMPGKTDGHNQTEPGNACQQNEEKSRSPQEKKKKKEY